MAITMRRAIAWTTSAGPNLFICDTSVFVTAAGVNLTLTAMAIASRASGHIAALAQRGEL